MLAIYVRIDNNKTKLVVSVNFCGDMYVLPSWLRVLAIILLQKYIIHRSIPFGQVNIFIFSLAKDRIDNLLLF